MIKEVHERIKIYNQEGVKHRVKSIPYFYFSKPKPTYYNAYNGRKVEITRKKNEYRSKKIDKVIDIEAYTYNVNEDGSFSKVELDWKNIETKKYVKHLE